MTTAEVLDKVKKLLALGKKSPYPGEAENALAAAQKLMMEHGLTSEQIEASKAEWTEEVAWHGAVMTYEIDVVAILVRDYFFVEAIIVETNLFHDGRKLRGVVLFGRPEDVAFAKYAFQFLCRTFRKRWNVHRHNYAPALDASESRAFFLGMGAGFAEKLHQQRQEVERERRRGADGAMIHVGSQLAQRRADVEAAFVKRHPGIETKARNTGDLSAGHYLAGIKEGHQIDLHRPFSAPKEQMRIGNAG